MHAPPTANPVRGIGHRPAMVAIMDAVLAYQFCDELVSEWFRTLLVDREMAVSLRTAANPGGMPGAA